MSDAVVNNDDLIGRAVGNYQVLEKIGEGGMGSVYLAQHPLIGKRVALKVLHREFSTNPDVIDRFFTEAKAVNDIQHPNIVDIIDYGSIPGSHGVDMVFFLMEFLDGQSIADVIDNHAPLGVERALTIASQIADALGASHAQGIIHRDLKPDNVFLIDRGRRTDVVKVLDFGIAKLTGDRSGGRRTQTGIVIGTPYYMSPEQCEGKCNVDHRTDVYALGVVLYEMLTGTLPFRGEGYGEILMQHLTRPPPPLRDAVPELSPDVEAVVLRALAKDRDHRYPSMSEFMTALADPSVFVSRYGGSDEFLHAVVEVDPPDRAARRTAPPALAADRPASPPDLAFGPTDVDTLGGIDDDPVAIDEVTALGTRRRGAILLMGTAFVALAAIAAVVVGRGDSSSPEVKKNADQGDSRTRISGSRENR